MTTEQMTFAEGQKVWWKTGSGKLPAEFLSMSKSGASARIRYTYEYLGKTHVQRSFVNPRKLEPRDEP